MIKTFTLFIMLNFSLLVLWGETISFALTEWAPYTSESLDSFGYNAEISKKAMEAVGYNVEMKIYPWSRCLEMAKIGEADGILPFYYNDDRDKIYSYTNKIASANSALMTLKNSRVKKSFNSIQDLSGYEIGVRRGNHHSKEFDEATFLTKTFTNYEENLIEMLLLGRIDIMGCSSVENIYYIISKKYHQAKDKVVLLFPYLSSSDLYVAFSRAIPNTQKLVDDFNKGLKIIKENGTYNKILEKHGVK